MIREIQELKKKKNAVILAHSYVLPEIVYGVADFVGDSYQLSKDAATTNADTIVFAAVRFMAETAKLLSPDKTVLLPATDGGCSLADSITAEAVKKLRVANPDFTFVCYINTTAAVKAACDVCVTSSNAVDIIEKMPNEKIYFLPDRLMAENIANELKARGVQKELKWTDGTCYVHEEYDARTIGSLRRQHTGVEVLAHPECSPAVVYHADFTGSTTQLMEHMKTSEKKEFLLLTECGLTDRMRVEMPEKQFIGSCQLCKYMKSNTLPDILRVLKEPQPADEITIEADIETGAKKCIEEMFRYAA